MYEKLLNKYAINQLGYIVDDLEEAARAHSALFGSGPFLYLDPITMDKFDYKGKPITVTTQIAYGQYGDVQIELIKVLSEPNPYFEDGSIGFHHVSVWVDDFEGAIADFAEAGFKPICEMVSGGGLHIAYIDCREKWGHCVEIHSPIKGFWDSVANKAKDWDGQEPFRKFPG
jgi:hypothetical protein